jgi:hypothetical protein
MIAQKMLILCFGKGRKKNKTSSNAAGKNNKLVPWWNLTQFYQKKKKKPLKRTNSLIRKSKCRETLQEDTWHFKVTSAHKDVYHSSNHISSRLENHLDTQHHDGLLHTDSIFKI